MVSRARSFIDKYGKRFISIVGMLGSDGVGERANAAALATKMLRDSGLSWEELLNAEAGTSNGYRNPELEGYRKLCADLRLKVARLEAENIQLKRAQAVPGKKIVSFAAAVAHLVEQIELRMELNEWEEGFLASMKGGRNKLSDKQRLHLKRLAERAGVPCDFLEE